MTVAGEAGEAGEARSASRGHPSGSGSFFLSLRGWCRGAFTLLHLILQRPSVATGQSCLISWEDSEHFL